MQALMELRTRVNNLIAFAAVNALVDTFNDPLVKSQIEDKVGEQLQRGERGDGSVLPNYSTVSVAVYGKPAGPMKLKDTGDFYRGETLEVDQSGFSMVNTDRKAEMLENRYGETIVDLQERSIDELKDDVILPNFGERVIKYLTQ